MTQLIPKKNLSGDQIEDLKQKAIENFWPHARHT